MIVVLTILAVLVMAGLFFWRPAWGVYTALALLPLDRIGTYALNPMTGHPVVRPALVAAIALVLATAARVAAGRETWRLPRPFWWLGALAAWAALPVIVIGYPALLKDYASGLLVISFCGSVALAFRHISTRWLVAALAVPAIMVSLFGIFQFLGDTYGLPEAITGIREGYSRSVFGFPRVHATASEPLYYANYLLLPFFASLALLLGGYKSRLLALALPLVSLNLIMTTSRGAYLGMLAGLVVVAAFMRSSLVSAAGKKSLLAVGAAAVAGLGLVMLASMQSYGDPLTGPALIFKQSTTQLAGTGSFDERVKAWNQALGVWAGSPIIGVGIGGYGYRLANYPDTPPAERAVVNNEVIELLVEVGAAGLLLITAFIASVGRAAAKALRTGAGDSRSWGAALAAIAVAMLIQLQTFSGFYVLTIWAALGLLAGWSNHQQKENRPAH